MERVKNNGILLPNSSVFSSLPKALPNNFSSISGEQLEQESVPKIPPFPSSKALEERKHIRRHACWHKLWFWILSKILQHMLCLNGSIQYYLFNCMLVPLPHPSLYMFLSSFSPSFPKGALICSSKAPAANCPPAPAFILRHGVRNVACSVLLTPICNHQQMGTKYKQSARRSLTSYGLVRI